VWLTAPHGAALESRKIEDKLLKSLHVKRRSEQAARRLQKQGDDVTIEHHPRLDNRGFSTADILWAIGIWSVILCLSPVIFFYVLMVA
jgi:hypothetical protein